ncbi:hypothetical protein SERLA73DRAFT_137149, partial [Serpula lacrymans var. lacrymans S7.3]
MSSMIGSAVKPATPSTPSPATTAFTTPASGAFSAFAKSGGFSAFTGGAKSFGELLRTGGDDPAPPIIPQRGKPTPTVTPQSLDTGASSEESYPSPTDDSGSKETVKEGKEQESISQKSSLASIPSSADSFVE